MCFSGLEGAEVGVESLPTGLPWARLDIFVALVKAQKSGEFDDLLRNNPKASSAVLHRFGLLDGSCYCTLQEVANRMGISRERVRQLEETALEYLGIED